MKLDNVKDFFTFFPELLISIINYSISITPLYIYFTPELNKLITIIVYLLSLIIYSIFLFAVYKSIRIFIFNEKKENDNLNN